MFVFHVAKDRLYSSTHAGLGLVADLLCLAERRVAVSAFVNLAAVLALFEALLLLV